MAYGGGYFTTYTKKMPGTYVNFSSALKASSVLSDRGIVFFGDSLNWGASGVTTLTLSDLESLQSILGYSQSADEMIKVREIFQHATKLHLYRLDVGGTKASNTYATAKYAGTRGNALTVVIANDTDNAGKYVVSTALNGYIVDSQNNIGVITDLEDNAYLDWKTNYELAVNLGTALTSGADGTGAVKAENTYATAKYKGTFGNKISIVIAEDTEHSEKFVVSTKFDGVVVDSQDNIADIGDLTANKYVDWKTGEITLEATEGLALTSGADGTDGVKASNIYSKAKYSGAFGNDLTVIIAEDTNNAGKFIVKTSLNGVVVDTQNNIAEIGDLDDNAYLEWEENEIALSLNAGTPLTGGANGAVTGQSYQDMLNTAESYVFNILAYEGNDNTTKGLFKAFTQRMREEIGANFQTVLYNYSANYEGIINVKNSADLVPWVAGAEAGCAVNASIENMTYDGEKTVSANYTQTQLIMAMDSGELVFHKVDDDYKVLKDINSLTTFTTQKGKNFGDNTTIRVNDQIGNDVAVMFNNQIMGKVQNDSEGRLYVWDKINDIMQALATARAISNYDSADLKVFAIEGDSSAIGAEIMYTPLNMLNKLYLTCIVA